MVDQLEFTDQEMRVATSAARRIVRVQRGLVEFDDVRSEIYLWMCLNTDKVERWAGEGREGKGKLHTALYRAGQRWAMKERARTTRSHVEDQAFYSEGMLAEILPDVFDRTTWAFESHDDAEGRTPARPGEGNNRLAMLVDVASGVEGLPSSDRDLLRERFMGAGKEISRMALEHNTSESTMRRRIKNVIRKLADNLGGEPPWV